MKFICSHWETIEAMLSEFDQPAEAASGIDLCVVSGDFDDYSENLACMFRKGGKLYHFGAGHCSCYGWEGQWEPEETTLETIKHYADKGYGDERECAQLFLKALADESI